MRLNGNLLCIWQLLIGDDQESLSATRLAKET